ncbi:peptidoglycan-binding protein [Xanthobacteraceae bacterium A53D]
MRIDFGRRHSDADFHDDTNEAEGAPPYTAEDEARDLRRRRRRDVLASLVLGGAMVAVLVNVFAFQHGHKPNFMFGFALPDAIRTRLSIAAEDIPVPQRPAPAPQAMAPVAPPAAAPAPVVAPAPPPAPPQSIAGLINETVAPRQPQPVVADVQRELARRGYYDGPADGLTGPKTDAAVRAFQQNMRLNVTGEANAALLAQVRRAPAGPVPPAGLPEVTGAIRPPGEMPASPRILAVQRTLAKLGYGPIKVTGRMSPETRQAVQRFERDRNLPADGEISDRMVRELAAVSGMSIE